MFNRHQKAHQIRNFQNIIQNQKNREEKKEQKMINTQHKSTKRIESVRMNLQRATQFSSMANFDPSKANRSSTKKVSAAKAPKIFKAKMRCGQPTVTTATGSGISYSKKPSLAMGKASIHDLADLEYLLPKKFKLDDDGDKIGKDAKRRRGVDSGVVGTKASTTFNLKLSKGKLGCDVAEESNGEEGMSSMMSLYNRGGKKFLKKLNSKAWASGSVNGSSDSLSLFQGDLSVVSIEESELSLPDSSSGSSTPDNEPETPKIAKTEKKTPKKTLEQSPKQGMSDFKILIRSCKPVQRNCANAITDRHFAEFGEKERSDGSGDYASRVSLGLYDF